MDLNFRILLVAKYFKALRPYIFEQPSTDWETQYQSYTSGLLTYPECMILVHPKVIDDNSANLELAPLEIQGPPRFAQSNLNSHQCRIDTVFNYRCGDSVVLEKDHFFPYSLGGPTTGENFIVLCEHHNRLKGNDYHWFPWEIFSQPPSWFAQQVQCIHNKLES